MPPRPQCYRLLHAVHTTSQLPQQHRLRLSLNTRYPDLVRRCPTLPSSSLHFLPRYPPLIDILFVSIDETTTTIGKCHCLIPNSATLSKDTDNVDSLHAVTGCFAYVAEVFCSLDPCPSLVLELPLPRSNTCPLGYDVAGFAGPQSSTSSCDRNTTFSVFQQ